MSVLCFIDTETTGLDYRFQQPYEVAYWREDGPLTSLRLPHNLDAADPVALKIGGYHERGFKPMDFDTTVVNHLRDRLTGVTLVGSNPAFDAAMLFPLLGAQVWHHRMIDVAQAAMWVFDWNRPKGLADVTAALVERGYDIPTPDHTAEGDVRTTRAVYEALRDLRGDWPPLTATPTEEAGA